MRRIKEINKTGKWTRSALRGCNFRLVTREGLSEKVTFGRRPEDEEANHVAIWARALLTYGIASAKGLWQEHVWFTQS